MDHKYSEQQRIPELLQAMTVHLLLRRPNSEINVLEELMCFLEQHQHRRKSKNALTVVAAAEAAAPPSTSGFYLQEELDASRLQCGPQHMRGSTSKDSATALLQCNSGGVSSYQLRGGLRVLEVNAEPWDDIIAPTTRPSAQRTQSTPRPQQDGTHEIARRYSLAAVTSAVGEHHPLLQAVAALRNKPARACRGNGKAVYAQNVLVGFANTITHSSTASSQPYPLLVACGNMREKEEIHDTVGETMRSLVIAGMVDGAMQTALHSPERRRGYRRASSVIGGRQ